MQIDLNLLEKKKKSHQTQAGGLIEASKTGEF